ncbi:hypothetical protein NEFER03_0912 [Nematocida sp. LUAm3]|nr:hypothetical protein NEFER03_0912 [Nematocida sp. LUAm3]KAI5174930.1 hypothetical protein NEFER02_1030 [Nematocida sp. LUAm2]KAI5177471.1 hypothetical protein NEFER01_0721 [Nematocida sp. LUAm1]
MKNHIEEATLPSAAKRLLEIIKKVKELIAGYDEQEMRRYLIEKREEVINLGKVIAISSGLPSTSEEAKVFGLFIVANSSLTEEESLLFLREAIKKTITMGVLRMKIIEFTKKVRERMEEEKKLMFEVLNKEIAVLKEIKQSEKGAKHDPTWKKEIEQLEKKLHDMKRTLEGDHREEKKSLLSLSESCDFIDTLSKIANLTCFCNFQRRYSPDIKRVAREILLHVTETKEWSYLNVLPWLCGKTGKLSVSMCLPKKIFSSSFPIFRAYILSTLRKLAELHPVAEDETRVFIRQSYDNQFIEKNELLKVLLLYSPDIQDSIAQIKTLKREEDFYATILSILYFLISVTIKKKFDQMDSQQKKGKKVIFLLRRINIVWHKHLFKKNKNLFLSEKRKKESEKLKNILEKYSVYDGVSMATSGIFSSNSIIYSYFTRYYMLKSSILHTMLQILTKDLSTAANEKYKRELKPNGAEEESFHLLIRRRILHFLRILSIKYLYLEKKKQVSIKDFLESISEKEYEKRGLFGYRHQIDYFLLMALPLIVTCASALQSISYQLAQQSAV